MLKLFIKKANFFTDLTQKVEGNKISRNQMYKNSNNRNSAL